MPKQSPNPRKLASSSQANSSRLPVLDKQTNYFAYDCAQYLLGLMLCLPFLQPVHALPIPSFYSEYLAVVLGLLASLFVLPRWLAEREEVKNFPLILSLPIALMALVLLQIVLGKFVYVSSALMILALLLWMACVLLSCRVLIQQDPHMRVELVFAKCLLWGAGLNAFLGLLQTWGVAAYLSTWVNQVESGGVYGNLAQQNHYASYLACGLAAALSLFRQKRMGGIAVMAWCTLLMLGLLLSGSRSFILYLLVCAAFFGQWRSLSLNNFKRRRVWVLGAVSLLIIVVLILSNSDWYQTQFQRYWYWFETLGARAFLWKHALQMWWQSVWMGVGWDSFAYHLVEQIGESGQVNRWGVDQYAHNLILQLAAVAGLLGISAVIVPLGLLAWRGWRVWRAGLSEKARFALAVLTILALHSMLEQPLYYAYFLGLAVCMLACVEPRNWAVKLPNLRWASGLLLFLALMGCVKTWQDYRLLEQSMNEGRLLTSEEIKALHEVSLFPAMVETLYPQYVVPHSASAQEKLKLNTRLMKHAPLADTEFRQAALLAEAGEHDAAAKRLRTAALAYPSQLELYAQRYALLAQQEPMVYASLAQLAQELLASLTQEQARSGHRP